MDFYLFQQINGLAEKWLWLDTLAIFFAQYLEYILVAVVFLFLLKDRKKYLAMIVQGFAAAIFARLVLVELIRWLWYRPRPFVENSVNLLLNHDNTSAFPSGHAAFFFALSLMVYFYNKKAGLCFLLASFLISISRVFCGIHWPSDIMAGAMVGIFSGWLIHRFVVKFPKK